MDWIDVTVARKWTEGVDIAAFELVAAGGGSLPPFEAGAHVEVLVPGGWQRPYSLCNAPGERHRYVIAVLREPRGLGGSKALHDQVRQGDRLRVGPPRNEFALASGSIYSVLLAGGVGVAPLLGMAQALWRRGAGFEFHYCARNPARAPFAEPLRRSPHSSRVRFHWTEEQGRIDFARLLERTPAASDLYLCGPAGFIESAVGAAAALRWRSERVHCELFRPAHS